MPQPYTWQYYLLDDNDKSLNYENDIVVNDVPVPIENTPDGWQDKLVNFGRNTKYFGLFRSFTIPLKFVTEGKRVLRHLLYTYGIEAICNLLIKKLNNAWTYDDYYHGEVDFSKFSDGTDYVTVNIMEGGLSKLLKAKEGTAFEIPVNPGTNPGIPVRMDGILFRSTLTYVMPDSSTAEAEHTIGIQFANQEGTSKGLLTGSSPLQNTSGFDPATSDDRWILNSTESSIDFNYKQTFAFGVSKSGTLTDVTYRAYFKKNTGAEVDIIPTMSIVNGEYTFNIDIDITLDAEEKLFVISQRTSSGFGACTISYHTDQPIITFSSKALPSNVYSRLINDVNKELINKITGGLFEAESNLLEGRTDLVITSGDAIRGLPNSVIKTNYNDFFKSVYSILNVGLGFENNKAKIEELAYFFDNTTEIANLGNISNCRLSIAEDLFFNSVKVGYTDQKYDDVNGRDEFNSTQVYQLPLNRIVKEWDLISPYRADCFGIEFARANLTEKKTTDSDSDNDVFVIQIEEVEIIESSFIDVEFGNTVGTEGTIELTALTPDEIVPGTKLVFSGTASNDGTFTITGLVKTTSSTIIITKEATTPETINTEVHFLGYKPKRGPYDSTPTGLISPESVFNVELSPHRNILSHKNYLASICDKLETKNATFQSGLKNVELVSSVGGVEITEKADILISDLGDKLFLPYYFTFDCQVPIDLVELMATNSRGYFSFTWLGKTYKGFPIDISIKPADNDIQEFKLLACSDNDLTTLINL